MKCKVCGMESGQYPLCRVCNIKKEKGEIIKCAKCNHWHYTNGPCPAPVIGANNGNYLYDVKKRLISKKEQEFFDVIKSSVPEGFCVFPQINLASFIEKNDDSKFRNELFRNVDFLITDAEYCPKFIVEINDQSHLNADRKERDEKVKNICEEAGIPIITFWTSYGANTDYIKKKVNETLNSLPIVRKHHFVQTTKPAAPLSPSILRQRPTRKKGCYIATCVYGSYDCPEVWTLRRYRDCVLSSHWFGRAFIKLYYAFSPILVKCFGNSRWFKVICKAALDKKVFKLLNTGLDNTPYDDV